MALTKVIGRGLGVQGDTVTGDDAALGFTSAEGLIITGQGSTNDVTIKNDADTQVCGVPTGTDDLRFPDNAQLQLGTGGDFKIYHDATNNYILGNGAHPMQFYTNDTLALKIDTNGIITKPLQSAFLAIPSSAQLNLALNAYTTIVFGTEVFDQNSDFASNTFTAPVTGKYQLNASVYLQSVDASTGFYQLYITTSNRDHLAIFSGNELAADPAYKNLSLSVLTDMDAGDTAIVRMQLAAGGNAQADVSVQARFFRLLSSIKDRK